MSKPASKRELLRQDRFRVHNPKFHLLIRNEKYIVKDFSQYGITAATNVEAHFVSEYTGTPLYLGPKILCILDLSKLRQKKVGNEFHVTFEVTGEPINSEVIETVLLTHKLIEQHLTDYSAPDSGLPTDYNNPDQVSVKFKRIVFMLLDWIEQLRRKIKHLENQHSHLSRADLEICHSAAKTEIVEFLARSLRPIYASMSKYMGGERIEDYQAAFKFFKIKMLEIVDLGKAEHLRDFWIDQVSSSNSAQRAPLDLENKNLFAKCLRQYFVTGSMEQIEQERERYLIKAFTDLYFETKTKNVRILGFGSSFGHQVDKIMHEHAEFLDADYEIHIMASELKALKKVQKKILHTKAKLSVSSDFSFTYATVESIIESGIDADDGKYNLAFALGLLDYLDDTVSEGVIRRLYACLGPKGRVVVSGTSVSNPLIFRMSLVLDRHLVYRDDKDFSALFERMSIPYELVCDSESAARFFILRKKN